MSDGPLIAIVGSVRQEISGSPEAEGRGRAVASAIGREMAAHKMRLVVYSSDEKFIEPFVVAGYAERGAGAKRAIHVHYPVEKAAETTFPAESEAPELFSRRADSADYWEASFYSSLIEADGLLLVGGGQSSIAAGHFVHALAKPIIAVHGFGGGSERIWKLLQKDPAYTGTDDLTAMQRAAPEAAATMVEGLAQRCTKRAEEVANQAARDAEVANQIAMFEAQSSRVWPAATFAAIFVALLLAGFVGGLPVPWFTGLFVASLFVAGLLGAAMSELWDPTKSRRPAAIYLFGGVAGLVAGLGYLVPLISTGEPGQPYLWDKVNLTAQLHLILVSLTSFLAGLAYDVFMNRARAAAERRLDAALTAEAR